jgi:hypothetical protein
VEEHGLAADGADGDVDPAVVVEVGRREATPVHAPHRVEPERVCR